MGYPTHPRLALPAGGDEGQRKDPALPSTHSANPDRAPTPAPDTTRGSEAEEAPDTAGLEDTYLLARLEIRSALRRRGPRLSLPGDPPRAPAPSQPRRSPSSPLPRPGRACALASRLPRAPRRLEAVAGQGADAGDSAVAGAHPERAGLVAWVRGARGRVGGALVREWGREEDAQGRSEGRRASRGSSTRGARGAPPGGLIPSSLATPSGFGAAPCGFQGPLPVVLYIRTRRPVVFCDVAAGGRTPRSGPGPGTGYP